MRCSLAVVLVSSAVALSPLSRAQSGGSDFERRLAAILPDGEELAWDEIPWRPTFWEAVLEAQAGERPILLWAMNGHPLGCT